jgi:hypothetical protein
MKRREFLQNAGMMAGYSLMVDATGFKIGHRSGSSASESVEESQAGGEKFMKRHELEADVCIAGGGMAGVCAALSAARNGSKVVLIQDRSRLGGNASSEVKMHIVGADSHGSHVGWREGGLIDELRVEDAVHNPHRAWELFDLMLYDKVISEPNITLLLDTSVFRAQVSGDRIETIEARCDKTERIYVVASHVFCDCTGDSRLALEAGAEFRRGREPRAEYGESYALEEGDMKSQGSSILFTARKYDKPMPYTPPKWSRKIDKSMLKHRGVGSGSYEYGFWWIELGGDGDTIDDNEQIRFELLQVVTGVWDYIKNSGDKKDSANWALQTVGMIPGKRESRRIYGDHVQTQADLDGGWRKRDDGVSIGGWGFDEHPPGGFNDSDNPPFKSIKVKAVYNIWLESLYSRNIVNMMMAGRNISSSHVAFTSSRVMATCACTGQAIGTAAHMCAAKGITPRELRRRHMSDLQQLLIKQDQTIRGVVNEDPDDLARQASVTSSGVEEGNGEAELIIDGHHRHMTGKDAALHGWMGEMKSFGAWIELGWSSALDIGTVQLTFDTGFHRQLTLSASDWVTATMVRGPQPETVKDYRLIGRMADGSEETLVEVKDNYERVRRHKVSGRVKALRLHVMATNGAETANVFEVRVYAD